MQSIEFQHVITVTGNPAAVESVVLGINEKVLNDLGTFYSFPPKEIGGCSAVTISGYASFDGDDYQRFKRIHDFANQGADITWHYYSNEYGLETRLVDFRGGQQVHEFRSVFHLFMEEKTIRDVDSARTGDLAAAKRLSAEMVEIAEEFLRDGADEPYPAAHMLSILFVLREIDYRPDPEHIKRWGTLLSVCREIDFSWADEEFVEDALGWLEDIYPACEMALVAFHEMEGESATCFPD